METLGDASALKKRKVVKRITLAFLLYQILGGLISSMIHLKPPTDPDSQLSVADVLGDGPGTERVICIDDNTEALTWRLCAIEQAREEIILSTFDLKADHSGTDVLSALYAAARRGVRVKILDDGMTGTLRLKHNDTVRALAAHPNVEIRLYNPLNILKPYRYTFRLHDKYLIVDQQLYISGGRNTYDLFLGDYSDHPNLDRDLLVYETDTAAEHTSLTALREYFEELWNASCCKPLSSKENEAELQLLEEHYIALQTAFPEVYQDWAGLTPEAQHARYLELSFPTNRITYLGNGYAPGVRRPVLFANLVSLMSQGQEVLMQSPYIVCNRAMYQGLEQVAQNTDQWEIITNAVESGANPWGCTDYLNQKDKILQTGVVVYEYLGDHSLHNKAIIIDDRLSLVGSYNLDMRSTYLDTELMLAVDSPELNVYLREQMRTAMESSKRVQTGAEDRLGSNYQPVEMTPVKTGFYAVLQVLIRGFRYLL